ncbi:MAG TPA: helix-turn-helix transcriptional regulator [Dictyobacter sp.]|nr:helix-turn-helix transcriptional regulator [Dictyobacter sp.]
MIRLRVKEVAEEKGLSMARLARRADIDFKTVQRLFHDPYRDISMSTLEKIARALSVPVVSLIEETDSKDDEE